MLQILLNQRRPFFFFLSFPKQSHFLWYAFNSLAIAFLYPDTVIALPLFVQGP